MLLVVVLTLSFEFFWAATQYVKWRVRARIKAPICIAPNSIEGVDSMTK